MRTLTTRQAELAGRRELRTLPIVKLTTYTDRAAKTGAVDHYYSTAAFVYDYGNTGTGQQVLPYLLSLNLQPEAIPHLPTGRARSDGRPLVLTLQNRVDATGEYLLETLRENEHLLFAEIEVAELLLHDDETIDNTAGLVGDEHLVVYRGEVGTLQGISRESFELFCQPQTYHWDPIFLDDATKNDPRDHGKQIPNLYGVAKRLPLLGWEVGWVTSLAGALGAGATGTTQVTDASGMTGSGICEISGERMSFTYVSDTSLSFSSRGQGGTDDVDHRAGETIFEVITASTWIAAEGPMSAIDATKIYAKNPVTGELVRVTFLAGPTRTVDNTSLLASGRSVGTVSFNQSQMQTIVEALAAQANVTTQPDIGHPITSTESQQATSGEANLRDGNLGTSKVIDNNISATNPFSVSVTFPDPPIGVGGGTITAQQIRVNIAVGSYGGTGALQIKSGTTIIGTLSSTGSQSWFTFSTTSSTSNDVTVICTGLDGAIVATVYEIERDVTFTQPDPTLDTAAAIQAAQYGFGLELFADCTGHVVPAADTSYVASAGNPILEAADVFRHLLQERLGLTTPIDETQWATAETRLAALDDGYWLSPQMGSTFEEFVAALEWETRSQLVRREESGGTKHQLLCADVPAAGSYDFGSTVATITEWVEIGERMLDDGHVFTRWRALYDPDPSLGLGVIDGHQAMIEATPDASDITGITTTELGNAEKAFGRRDHPTVLVQASSSAHVEDLIGYYVHEHMRELVLAEIRGIPWTESYALELGDVVGATFPWWPAEKSLRIVQLERSWLDRTVDILAVEVP